MFYGNEDVYDSAVEGTLDRYGQLGWSHPILQSVIFHTYNGMASDPSIMTKPDEEKVKIGPNFLIIRNESKTFRTSYLDCKMVPYIKYFIPVNADHVESIMTEGVIKNFEFKKEMDDECDHWVSFIGSWMKEDVCEVNGEDIYISDVYKFNPSFTECGNICETCNKVSDLSKTFRKMFYE